MLAHYETVISYDAQRDTYVFQCYRDWIRNDRELVERELVDHEEIGNFRDLYRSWLCTDQKKNLYPWEVSTDAESAKPRALLSAAGWALNGNGGKLKVIKHGRQ